MIIRLILILKINYREEILFMLFFNCLPKIFNKTKQRIYLFFIKVKEKTKKEDRMKKIINKTIILK